MRTPAEIEAVRMLIGANMPRTPANVRILALDINAVADEDNIDLSAAATVLRIRIGGIQNLDSYMSCLKANPTNTFDTGEPQAHGYVNQD